MRIDLQTEEHIVCAVVRHWWRIFARGANILILFFVPLIAVRLLAPIFAQFGATLPEGSAALGVFFLALFALGLWVVFFTFWTDYYLDAYYLTNKRIIYVEQKGFFSREVSSFRLDRIQDISSDTPDFLATMLNFGDIEITTASALQPFVMRTVPNPDGLKNKIIAEMETHHTGLPHTKNRAQGARENENKEK